MRSKYPSQGQVSYSVEMTETYELQGERESERL